MRRVRLAAGALAGVAVSVLVVACSAPAGLDGELVDDWPAPPEATVWTPAAATCHSSSFLVAPTREAYQPVDCAQPHVLETVHVGQVSGGSRPALPPDGSPERRAAYQECLTRTTDFLGADWRTARLWLGVALPSTAAWQGGARWFRCDLWEVKSKDDPTEVPRRGSLKDALRGGGSLAYGCYTATVKNDNVEAMTAVDCAKPHNAEFAGVHVAGDVPYPKTDKARDDLAFAGCRGVVARYTGVPDDANFFFRMGLIVTPYSEEEWRQGNRGIRCHLWLSRTVSKSMKGAGPGALPAR
jgi:hypothetical protein